MNHKTDITLLFVIYFLLCHHFLMKNTISVQWLNKFWNVEITATSRYLIIYMVWIQGWTVKAPKRKLAFSKMHRKTTTTLALTTSTRTILVKSFFVQGQTHFFNVTDQIIELFWLAQNGSSTIWKWKAHLNWLRRRPFCHFCNFPLWNSIKVIESLSIQRPELIWPFSWKIGKVGNTEYELCEER